VRNFAAGLTLLFERRAQFFVGNDHALTLDYD